jgi:hypothetical protein
MRQSTLPFSTRRSSTANSTSKTNSRPSRIAQDGIETSSSSSSEEDEIEPIDSEDAEVKPPVVIKSKESVVRRKKVEPGKDKHQLS